MKRVFYALLTVLGFTLYSHAATRGDVKIIEASENIRYLSQKIVKEYLYLYKNPQKREVRDELNSALKQLSNNFRDIALTTKDSDTKDILEFLVYSKDQIKQMINAKADMEKADMEKAALMLDYSEILLEGANSISQVHRYAFSKEEKMLMVAKKMEYLLERMIKYYMAFSIGLQTQTNQEQLRYAMKSFEENLAIINAYSYPSEFQKYRSQINIFWEANRLFFKRADTILIPNLLNEGVEYLENILVKIALYHSKHQ
jgi:hypothetical protein